MKLIRKLGTRLNKSGNKVSWAEFLCEFDNRIVERKWGDGLKQKSCGCVRYKLSSESNKGKKRTDEQNKRSSEAHKGKKLTEEHRQKIRKALQGENNPFYGKNHTEETRQKMRESHKSKTTEKHEKDCKCYGCNAKRGRTKGTNNPMYGIHLSGELNPNWSGGKSFEIYPQEFKQIKKSILERDNHTCQNPNCVIDNPKRLDCHHIDYDKNNNNPENLITLCTSCHAKTNGKNKRKYYTEYYQNIMMYKLMECLL